MVTQCTGHHATVQTYTADLFPLGLTAGGQMKDKEMHG